MLLRARHFEFRFPRPAMLLGIVNVTPDSFSDGGRFLSVDRAVEHALQLVAEGADILDIGGESTRPHAAPVSEEEELRRVLPVICALAQQPGFNVPISIDSMKPAVARAALEAGASIVNDVAAHRTDPAMWKVVRETGAAYVVMHMQGTPETMQRAPHYTDVVAEVGEYFAERFNRLQASGVSPEQIIFDPGIGFGKTLAHNLELLAGVDRFGSLQRPLLVGASRKAFIGEFTGAKDSAARLPGSLACAIAAVEGGAQLIRTHDVAATRQALRMSGAIQGLKKQ